jgi:hypothetical protein
MFPRFAQAYRSAYDAHGHANTSLFPGVRDTLEALSTLRPKVRLGVATTKRGSVARDLLRTLDAEHFFDVIEGSAGTDMPHKPAPDLLLHVCDKLDVARPPPACPRAPRARPPGRGREPLAHGLALGVEHLALQRHVHRRSHAPPLLSARDGESERRAQAREGRRSQVGHEGLAGDPLVGRDVAPRGLEAHLVGQRGTSGPSPVKPCAASQRRTYSLSKLSGSSPARAARRSSRRTRSATSRACASRRSRRCRRPAGGEPAELVLGVDQDEAPRRAVRLPCGEEGERHAPTRRPCRRSEIDPARRARRRRPTRRAPPFRALVLGVTMRAGSGSFLRRPSGSAWPQKVRSPRA